MTFERLMTQEEAGAALGVATSTLEKWRVKGDGPPFLKLGHLVRYSPSALQRYLSGCERSRTISVPSTKVG